MGGIGGMGGMGGTGRGGLQNQGEGMEQPADETILVEAEPAGNATIELSTSYIGKVEPAQSVDVFPEMSARVTATYFEVGDTVQQGDLLFEMDASDIQQQVEAAALSYESTKLQIESSLGSTFDSQLISGEANYDKAKLSYNQALKSLQSYRDEGDRDDLEDAVEETRSAMKEAQSVYEAAQKDVEEKQKQIDSYQPTVGSSGELETLQSELKYLQEIAATAMGTYTEAQNLYNQAKSAFNTYDDNVDNLIDALSSANINLRQAEDSLELTTGKALEETKAKGDVQLRQAQLSYNSTASELEKTRVYAPISGVIGNKNISEYGTASQQAAAYTILNSESMLVSFHVSASAIDSVRAGDLLSVSKGSETFQGTVVEIGQELDSTTGLLSIKAQIEPGESTLVSGMTVKVSAVTAKAENVLTVPLSAVSYEEGQGYLYVLDGNTAVKTAVSTGLSNTERVEITHGLSQGDRVITTWHPDLADGVTVAVLGEASAAEDAGSRAEEQRAPDAAASLDGNLPEEQPVGLPAQKQGK